MTLIRSLMHKYSPAGPPPPFPPPESGRINFVLGDYALGPHTGLAFVRQLYIVCKDKRGGHGGSGGR